MIVVSDASPLVSLANVGRTDLLPALFGRVLVPSAVRDEIVRKWPGPFPPPWLDVADPAGPPPAATAGLDCGEAQAIALALERGVDLLLIDEQKGRRIGKSLGLTARGVLSVLVDAKHAGLVPSAADAMDELAAVGFYCSAAVRAEALRLAGEAAPPMNAPAL